MNVADCFIKQLAEVGVLIWDAVGSHAKATGYHLHIAEYHIGVFDKIAVHRDTVCVGIQMYP